MQALIKSKTKTITNFSAGPSFLPDIVNKKILTLFEERLNTGISILEISHRSSEFIDLKNKLESYIQQILKLPSDYDVLFMPAGARAQNAAIPMNFISTNRSSPIYLTSGFWSTNSASEAKKYSDILIDNLHTPLTNICNNSAYYFYTNNETIDGVYLDKIRYLSHDRVVCDMSSSLFACRQDVKKFSLIFAASQKNIGIPGMALVIVKKSFLQSSAPMLITPSILNYKNQKLKESMYNTPNNLTWVISLFMMEWIMQEGIDKIQSILDIKARKIYDFFDGSAFYSTFVNNELRSKVNITFTTNNKSLDDSCISYLYKQGIVGVKGHNKIGGLRLSLYVANFNFNIDFLLDCLINFEKMNTC
mgnify:CR=1 FL=1